MSNKAKRHITEFDFEKDGASVHLVSRKQGGAANGFKTLIMKSTKTEHLPDIDPNEKSFDLEKKLEQVKVTMSMESFLKKFFDMYYDDAELLTAMLGYQTEFQEYLEKESETETTYSHQDYISEKLEGFEIMKSMHEQTNKEVSASDILNILEIQEKLETPLKEETMDNIRVAKSRLEELENLEKSHQDTLELVKSLKSDKENLETQIAEIKAEQEESQLSVMKSRLKGLVNEDRIERMAKSLVAMSPEASEDFIETLSLQKSTVEGSNLFQEVGNEGEKETISDKEQKDLDMKKAFDAQMAALSNNA